MEKIQIDPDTKYLDILNGLSSKDAAEAVEGDGKGGGTSHASDRISGLPEQNPYTKRFTEVISGAGLHRLILDSHMLAGTMADMRFDGPSIIMMKIIQDTSQDLLLKILKGEKCDIERISDMISMKTAFEAKKVEVLLNGLYAAASGRNVRRPLFRPAVRLYEM